MSAKELAIQDIKNELEKNHKCFLAFRTELNPIMDKLVSEHLKAQQKASNQVLWPSTRPSRSATQLIARCFFCKSDSSIKYDNYSEYYDRTV